LRDVLWMMKHPGGERTEQLLEEHDIGYVVLYKDMPPRSVQDFWKSFNARPDLYQMAFENDGVLIVAPRRA
jgi:hypothetical protein